MKFYDREKEIKKLRSFKDPFIIAVVGRRRVGKTRLVMESFPECIYLFASEEKSEKALSGEWVERIREGIYIPHMEKIDRIIEYLVKTQDRVIFIDEVQNLEKINPAIISRIQRILDENRDRARVIFCGSYVSMVNRMFTSSKSPLFGRTDMVLFLKELDFRTVREICRDMGIGFKDSIVFYSIFGGMPRYYELLEKSGEKRPERFIKEMFFDDLAPLKYEGSLVLRNEFGGEYRTYFSIMEAISSGKSTLTEISDYVGIKPQSISKYIAALKDDLDLIYRKVPVTEDERRSKMGRYFIKNNFYSFWFRFVHRNYSLMEEGNYGRVYEKTILSLSDHTARVFEDIIRDIVRERMDFDTVGSWWNRRGDEIDIVALNEKKKEILFGEVKWRNRPIACNVIDELMEKKELVKWHNEDRKEKFLIVSKAGFTKKCIEKMDSEGIMHWDLGDVERMLS